MATIKYFQDLQIWQKARLLNKAIYTLTETASFSKDYSLKDQMRRASISVLSNIAEGFDREGNKEFLQFLSIAKGSLGELHSQLYASLDIKYTDNKSFEDIENQIKDISRMMKAFMNYLRSSEVKGIKYLKEPEAHYGNNKV